MRGAADGKKRKGQSVPFLLKPEKGSTAAATVDGGNGKDARLLHVGLLPGEKNGKERGGKEIPSMSPSSEIGKKEREEKELR